MSFDFYYWGPIESHIYALSIGAKINDLGWPRRVIRPMHSVSKLVRRGVNLFYIVIFSFTFNLLLGNTRRQPMLNLTLARSVL